MVYSHEKDHHQEAKSPPDTQLKSVYNTRTGINLAIQCGKITKFTVFKLWAKDC